jgi:hypothetical protein
MQMRDLRAYCSAQADKGLRSYGSDSISVGNELIWLSQVLPPAALGNTAPYNTTGTPTRQAARQYLPLLQMYCQSNPSFCQTIQAALLNAAPSMEDQIYALAVLSEN